MSTDYTHFTKLAFTTLFARGSDGQEQQVMDADGNLTIPGLTLSGDTTIGSAATDALLVKAAATFSSTLTVAGTLTATGSVALNGTSTTIGNASSDTVTITADVASNLIPEADGTRNIGESASRWAKVWSKDADFSGDLILGSGATDTMLVKAAASFSSTLQVQGTLTALNNTVLGNASSDTVTVTADVASNLIPDGDSTRNIGESASRWNEGWFTDLDVEDDITMGASGTLTVSTGGTIVLPNSAVSDLPISFASDPDMGIYRVGADVFGIATEGTLQVRINTSQVEFTPKGYFAAGVRTKNSTANVTNPPTDAELDSAFGTGATVGTGFVGTLDDSGGGSNAYLVFSDGTNWWYIAGTKAT